MPEAVADLTPTAPAAPPGIDLGALVQSGAPSTNLFESLAGLQQAKVQATDAEIAKSTAQLDEDRSRVGRAVDAMGVGPDTVKPWDVETERAKYRTDPLDSFASLGSTFALLASAFTHQPMVNALNGAASAMNAIKAGNDEEYKLAYTAWKDNTELAMKRFDMQHRLYQTAADLYSRDMTAGRARMEQLFTQFGDQQKLLMLQNGMDKDVFDTMRAEQNLKLGLAQAWPKIVEDNARINDLLGRGYDMQNPSNPANKPILQQWAKDWAEIERAKHGSNLLTTGRLDAAEIDRRAKEYEAQGLGKTEAYDKAKKDVSGLSKVDTIERQKAARMADLRKQNPERPQEQITAQVNREFAAAMTPNRRDQLQARVDMIQNVALDSVDKLIRLGEENIGIAGAFGAMNRVFERAGNILGSQGTDRVQYMRWLQEVKELAPRILTDSQGRPLAAEAKRVDDIVAGLSSGDTGPNTLRALRELRDTFKKVRDSTVQRIEGNWQAPPGSSALTGVSSTGGPVRAPAPTGPSSAAPWLRDPVYKE